MRKGIEFIAEKLESEGWVCLKPSSPDEYDLAVYTKSYGGNIVSVDVALERKSVMVEGCYGIINVSVYEYVTPLPYNRDDLKIMESVISKAENGLVDAGVPFRADYPFGDRLEENIGRNLDIREHYGLSALEAEDYGLEVTDHPHLLLEVKSYG